MGPTILAACLQNIKTGNSSPGRKGDGDLPALLLRGLGEKMRFGICRVGFSEGRDLFALLNLHGELPPSKPCSCKSFCIDSHSRKKLSRLLGGSWQIDRVGVESRVLRVMGFDGIQGRHSPSSHRAACCSHISYVFLGSSGNCLSMNLLHRLKHP